MEEKDYTVQDLIDELEKLDKNLIIWHEGCDCYGKWNGKIKKFKDGSILIERYE